MEKKFKYILSFNQSKMPKVKIRYNLERVEQFITVSLRCYKCQGYGHHKQGCRRHQIYGKCDKRDPDHTEEDSPNETKCPNCQESHLAFSRSCDKYKSNRKYLRWNINKM